MLRWRELFVYEAPDDVGGAPPAPGTGEEATPGELPDTSAQTETADTGQTPGPIPYSRFQEVNAARRELAERIAPYEELGQMGYGADDLQRLAAWEMEYVQDPQGWLMNQLLADDGTAEEVKAAIQAVKDGGNAETPPASPAETPKSDEVPEWAKPLLQDREARQQAEAEASGKAVMDSIVEAWKQIDTTEEVTTPDRMMYQYIALAAGQGVTDPAQVLSFARRSWLADREEILNETASTVKNGDTPLSVPGGGGGEAALQVPKKPRTLDEARRMAEEADARGGLVMTD